MPSLLCRATDSPRSGPWRSALRPLTSNSRSLRRRPGCWTPARCRRGSRPANCPGPFRRRGNHEQQPAPGLPGRPTLPVAPPSPPKPKTNAVSPSPPSPPLPPTRRHRRCRTARAARCHRPPAVTAGPTGGEGDSTLHRHCRRRLRRNRRCRPARRHQEPRATVAAGPNQPRSSGATVPAVAAVAQQAAVTAVARGDARQVSAS